MLRTHEDLTEPEHSSDRKINIGIWTYWIRYILDRI